MRQAIVGADQGVALIRRGDEWSWLDGQIEGNGGWPSAEEALADYQSNPPLDEGEKQYTTVTNVSIETVYARRT